MTTSGPPKFDSLEESNVGGQFVHNISRSVNYFETSNQLLFQDSIFIPPLKQLVVRTEGIKVLF